MEVEGKMNSLLIVGAGEYGHLVKEIAELLGYQKVDFLDDNSQVAIGKMADYQKFIGEYREFIVAIGNPLVRRRVVEQMENNFSLATIIHPTAFISKSAMLKSGCVIEANSVINTAVEMGKACLINAGAVVNHNSIVADYCQIDCNAVVAADTKVPENTKIHSCTVWKAK